MAAEVFFRGPILFLDKAKKENVGLLPDAERMIRSDDGVPGCHADGTESTPHYAGLIVAEGKQVVVQLSLRKKIVVISDESGSDCEYKKKCLVPIDDMANAVLKTPMTLLPPTDPDYWVRVATRVTFNGGTMSDWRSTRTSFRLPPKFASAARIVVGPKWTSTKGVTRIEIRSLDGTETTTLYPTPTQHVYIYNWDEQFPDVDDLTRLPAPKRGKMESEDRDFKWLYQLYDVPGRKFTRSLPARVKLPAPICTGENILSVGSAGCVGGGGHG